MTEQPSHTLVTGASGFIGGEFVQTQHPARPVLGLSRKPFESEAAQVQGDFASFEDLRQLDSYQIGSLVHLAAVTGGCSEEDGIEVNVAGTRRLLRYLLDRGCRNFVLASSIAATGCLDPDFVPQQLPIGDEHPCLARDSYGLSKALMEEMVHYFSRLYPDAAWTLLRFGAVINDKAYSPPHTVVGTPQHIPFATMALVGCSDVLRAIELALVSPVSGVRTYNVVGPDSTSTDTPHAVLQDKFGDRLSHIDWSHYEQPGGEHAALYAMDKIRRELGFEPTFVTRETK